MKSWMAVASAEHVRNGRAQGFMQVCHGKAAPLRRLKPNDWVVYYEVLEIAAKLANIKLNIFYLNRLNIGD